MNAASDPGVTGHAGPTGNHSSAPSPVVLRSLKERLDEYGFVVLRNLIPTNEITAIAARLKALMGRQSKAAKLDQSLRGLLRHDEELLRPLLLHPTCLALAELTLGKGFQTAEVSSRWLKPGAPAQDLHMDVKVTGVPESVLRTPDVWFIMNCLWLLSDFTFENGATLLLPFSHHSRSGPREGVEYEHLVPVEAPAGSLLVMHGRLWHKGGANITKEQQRIGLGVVYQSRWIDPAAGRWEMIERDACERLSPAVRSLNRHSLECRAAETGDPRAGAPSVDIGGRPAESMAPAELQPGVAAVQPGVARR